MANKKKLQLCTAGADAPVKPADIAKTWKQIGTDLQTTLAGLIPDLEEPLKAKWSGIVNTLQTTLASMPDVQSDEDVTKALPAIMNVAQTTISDLRETNKDLTTKLQTTLAGIPAQIEEAITAKVKAGEYVTKDQHAKDVGDATSAATTAARASALQEAKRINERTMQLTAASIPVPAAEKLAGDDEAYNKAKESATKRQGELAPYKLPADRLLTLCWDTDEAAYQSTVSLMKSAFDAASKGAPASPFMNPIGGDKQPSSPIKGVC